MDENNTNTKNQADWNECCVTINGTVYRFHCTITEENIFELYLNNRCIVSEKYRFLKLKGFDRAIEIGGKTMHCVFDEEKLDVAIDGKYLKSQRNYIPLKAVYIICMILSILTPIMVFMAVVGTSTMYATEVALCLAVIMSVRIYYTKGNKDTKVRG